MPDPLQLRRVRGAGPALAVRDHAGGEPALLALHGLASNARWWDLVAERLAPRHRVLALDLRGHGRSDRPESGYDLDTVSADAIRALDELHPAPLAVAGHSWGASVAVACAAAAPERFLGVACVDGGAFDLRAHFGASWEVAEQAMTPPDLRGVEPATLRAYLEASPLAEGSDPETAAELFLANFEDDGSGRGTLRPRLRLDHHMAIARDLVDQDADALLSRLRCPVLFLPAGGGDDVFSETKRQAMERVREVLGEQARIEWIDGGHDLPVQRPQEVADALRRFLAVLPPPEG